SATKAPTTSAAARRPLPRAMSTLLRCRFENLAHLRRPKLGRVSRLDRLPGRPPHISPQFRIIDEKTQSSDPLLFTRREEAVLPILDVVGDNADRQCDWHGAYRHVLKDLAVTAPRCPAAAGERREPDVDIREVLSLGLCLPLPSDHTIS